MIKVKKAINFRLALQKTESEDKTEGDREATRVSFRSNITNGVDIALEVRRRSGVDGADKKMAETDFGSNNSPENGVSRVFFPYFGAME